MARQYTGKRSSQLTDFIIEKWGGLNTSTKDIKLLQIGQSPDSLNWITGPDGDHIELRRGSALLHSTRQTGVGAITGLGVGYKFDQTQIPFYSYGRKVFYYDSTVGDSVEVGTDMLPTAASGEDIIMRPYQNIAGSFMYITSPNSSIYKIPVANPGSSVDLLSTTYRFGVMNITQGRMIGGQRNGTSSNNADKTGFYESYIDKSLVSSYTQTTGESYGTGDGTTKTFTHTVTNIGAKKTSFYAQVTDGVETFTDNRNGVMSGSLGGTGTINYATGATSVTFNTAPANLAAITCSYYIEDATSQGIADFSFSATRTTGQGNVLRQDDGGGNMMSMFPFQNVIYCLHQFKTWQVTNTIDDTKVSNDPYRDHAGVPYPRASFSMEDGILYLDNTNPAVPRLRILRIQESSPNTTIVPESVSDELDLSVNDFTSAIVFYWGDFQILACRNIRNGVADTFNGTMYVRQRPRYASNGIISGGYWSKLDYPVTSLAEYLGTLISGDSQSNNVYTLFSGFDDDGSAISNYWTSGSMNLGIDGVKKANRMVLEGLIQKTQKVDVYVSYDSGPFTKVFTLDGSGNYVDLGNQTTVGSYTVGSKIVGGGGGTVFANSFRVDFPITSDRFEYMRIKLQATDVGYVQFDRVTIKDLRYKGRHLLPTQTI